MRSNTWIQYTFLIETFFGLRDLLVVLGSLYLFLLSVSSQWKIFRQLNCMMSFGSGRCDSAWSLHPVNKLSVFPGAEMRF